MKSAITLIIVLISVACCRAQSNDVKYWQKDSLLIWDDFKGPVDTATKMSAYTSCYITYRLKQVNQGGKDVFVCTARCHFDKNKSWSVKHMQGIVLLAHEQLHFDIAEYFRRLFERTINDKHYTEVKSSEVGAIFRDIMARTNQMQLDYDAYTVHGSDIKKQRTWTNFLADVLENNLSDEEFVAKIPK